MKTHIKILFELFFTWFVKKYVKHYTHIEELPLWNFYRITQGNLAYLYKNMHKRIPKVYFNEVFQNMHYQFKQLDNEYLRAVAMVSVYECHIVTAKTEQEKNAWKNKHAILKNKLHNWPKNIFDLDKFTDYIEQTFKLTPGSIDVKKISTSKAFSNYQKAIEMNQQSETKK